MTIANYQFITKAAEDAFTNALTRARLYNGQEILLDDLCAFIMNCNLYLWQGEFHIHAAWQAFSTTFDKDVNKALEVLYEFNAFFKSALTVAGLGHDAHEALLEALHEDVPIMKVGEVQIASKATPEAAQKLLSENPWYYAIASIRVYGFPMLMKVFNTEAAGKPNQPKKNNAK